MDNVITGAIAVAIFLAFVLGLAESIGKIPFALIVIVVSGMILIDYYQSIKEGLKKDKEKEKENNSAA